MIRPRPHNDTVWPAEMLPLISELESLNKLLRILLEKRNPIDQTVLVSAVKPWIIDYQGYKHVFLWIPVASGYTLSFEDYGQGAVPGQNWIDLGIPQGNHMTVVGQATLVEIMLRFTDEVIP